MTLYRPKWLITPFKKKNKKNIIILGEKTPKYRETNLKNKMQNELKFIAIKLDFFYKVHRFLVVVILRSAFSKNVQFFAISC